MTIHNQMIELVELYALDALVGPELVDFETHLESCQLCQSQLSEALTVTAALVADSAPPTHVWDRIVAAIEPAPQPVIEFPRRRKVFLTLTAVAAALAVALGGILIAQNNLTSEESLIVAAEKAAAEPGSTVAELMVEEATVAEVVLTTEGTGYILPTEALADLDDSRTYQLWVINKEGSVISGGVLGHSPGASSFTWTDDVSGFALTREKAGGVAVSEGDLVAGVTDI